MSPIHICITKGRPSYPSTARKTGNWECFSRTLERREKE